jgi:hypothetical protein
MDNQKNFPFYVKLHEYIKADQFTQVQWYTNQYDQEKDHETKLKMLIEESAFEKIEAVNEVCNYVASAQNKVSPLFANTFKAIDENGTFGMNSQQLQQLRNDFAELLQNQQSAKKLTDALTELRRLSDLNLSVLKKPVLSEKIKQACRDKIYREDRNRTYMRFVHQGLRALLWFIAVVAVYSAAAGISESTNCAIKIPIHHTITKFSNGNHACSAKASHAPAKPAEPKQAARHTPDKQPDPSPSATPNPPQTPQ